MDVLRVARYRLRCSLRRRSGSYVGLALLVGLLGGVALAAVAAARRTDSSYPKFVHATHPSDLIVQPPTGLGFSPGFVSQLRALPHVKQVENALEFNAATLTKSGRIASFLATQAGLVASTDGLFSNQDRLTILHGRAADAMRADEIVVSPQAAAVLRLRVGSRVEVGIYSNAQRSIVHPYREIRFSVVGIGLPPSELVQDDVDRLRSGFLVGTPALARELKACCVALTYDGLRLTAGGRDDAAVEREYARLLLTSRYIAAVGGGAQVQVYETAAIEAQAQRAIRPEVVALAVFGLIAALAAVLIGGQLIARLLRSGADQLAVLRALGASPRTTASDGLPGILCAVAAGVLLAAVIAGGLSPLGLFGPVRTVEPSSGISLDWTVLGLGAVLLAMVLSAIAVLVGRGLAPHRRALGRQLPERGSSVVRLALAAGLSAPGLVGLRLALEPGRARSAVPVRAAILGTILAVVVVAASLTFGASLDRLVSHPSLYGWNFDYALYSDDGFGPIPARVADPLLARDPHVAAATGVYFPTVQIDGHTVPGIATLPRPAIEPPSLSGRPLTGANQIVLGPASLATIHKRIGDLVELTDGKIVPPVRLRIVGTATFPTVGTTLGVHASMSTGAYFSVAVAQPAILRQGGSFAGPSTIFVRLKPGANRQAGQRSLEAIAARVRGTLASPAFAAYASPEAPYAVTISLLPAQRPAEIVNYRSMGAMPAILAGGLAAGALVALGLTLLASVRRRRRQLALLRVVGFTGRQLAMTVAWQATVIATLGLLIGLPLGIAAGRGAWTLFAHALSAVSSPVVPPTATLLLVAGTLVLANVVAAVPGRAARRVKTVTLLRAG